MAELKLAYVYVAGGADPEKHRVTVPTPPGLSIVAVGVKDYPQGVEICRRLVDEGVQMIELCPGFGNIGVGMVAEAVGGRAVVGVVRVDRLPVLDCGSGDALFRGAGS
jgi:hypothetical protein